MRKNGIILLLAIISSVASSAQLLTNSPYSRYGLGETHFQGFADQIAMGSTGRASRNSLTMSLLNPASYSAFKMTNYRFGVASYLGTLTQGNQSLKVNSAALRYFALGFQLNKKKDWGLAVGAMPYSSTGYNIEYKVDSSFGSINNVLQGKGDITRMFIGTGKDINDNLALGFQASYLFGKISDSRTIDFPSNIPYLDYRESSTDYIRGFMFEAGAQYHINGRIAHYDSLVSDTAVVIRRDTTYLQHNFGLTFQLSNNVNTRRELYARTFEESNGIEYVRDTISLIDNLKGKTTLPSTIGFGYSLANTNGRWRLALDYSYTLWSLYKNGFSSESLNDNHQFGIGYSFRPSVRFHDDNVNIFQKTEYRFGARYSTPILNLNNTGISEYGISFGLGIPLRTRTITEEFKFQTVFSSLDIGVEYVQRGTLNNNLIQENYWRFVFGVSLNDKWFNKRKID